MIFTSATVDGAVIVDPEPHRDDRGIFVRTYCERECAAHELATGYPQCNVSYSRTRFTLRGLHYVPPRSRGETRAVHTGLDLRRGARSAS